MGSGGWWVSPQVAAVCAYPELLSTASVPADAKRRAGQILRHLHGGSPGTAGTGTPWLGGGQPHGWGEGHMVGFSAIARPVTAPPSPGAYNLEYVTETVAEKVARYLERRDGGTPSDPRCVVPCGGTAAAVVVSAALGTGGGHRRDGRGRRGPSSHGGSSR